MSSPFIIGLQGDPATWANPPAGKTAVGVNQAGLFTLKQSDGSITTVVPSAPGVGVQASGSGNITVTLTAAVFAALITLSGAARTVPIILATAGVIDGSRLTITVLLANIAGLALDFRNGTGGGAQVASFTSEGEPNGCWEFVMIAGTWTPLRAQVQAY